ncbi:MAG: hypothetical protein LBL31_03020 [Spirochaetaceae bacterium]|nr:hypothetical protein [Spirochaetaceae bacterium]
MIMRKPRVLKAHAWYLVSTAVNRHEPIFLERNAVSLFNRVFREAVGLFPVEVRRLRIEADRVSFYIRPVYQTGCQTCLLNLTVPVCHKN